MTLPTTCPDCKQPLSIMEDWDGTRLLTCVPCADRPDEALAPALAPPTPPTNSNRIATIQTRLTQGDRAIDIARDLGISRERVRQLIEKNNLTQPHAHRR